MRKGKSSDNKVIDTADIDLVIKSWINDIKQSTINNNKFSKLKQQLDIHFDERNTMCCGEDWKEQIFQIMQSTLRCYQYVVILQN